MKRDMEEFKNFGYSEENAQQLEKDLKAFLDIPTDEETEGDRMIVTERKNKIQRDYQERVRELMIRVRSQFGKDSALNLQFGVHGLANLSDNALLRLSGRIARLAEIHLEELLPKGFTKEEFDSLNQLAGEFELALYEQDMAKAQRDIATDRRAKKASEIYKEISKICETGKEIWNDLSEAKYNDYIIYNTPSGKPEKQYIEEAEE